MNIPLEFKKTKRDMFELVRVDRKETNLGFDIFLDSLGCNRKNVEPCIYMVEKNSMYSIPLKRGAGLPNNAEFDPLSAWISDNIEILILHWYKRITDKEVFSMLKRLKEK